MAQFPEDVYRNAGASDVLPLVMKNVDEDKISAIQFLRAGKVRLTFQDSETCSQVLKDGLDFGDFSVDLLPADDRLRAVHVRDLPVEIEEEAVSRFLSGYGEVLSVSHCFFDEYPNVRNGNRVAKVLLDHDIPQFIEIDGCNCRTWYPRQPPQCPVCREPGHRAPACPLSGLCRRCHQPGHMARECTQAWGPPPSVPRNDHSMDVEEDSDAGSSDSVPSTTASVTLPSVTSPPVISTSPVTAVCSTVATPTSRPTVAVTTPVNVSTGSTTAASVSAPLASVSTASTVSTASASKSSSSNVSAPSSKKPRTVISREIFLRCLAKLYPTVELPSFDNAKGKEWDTRAKAYIRQKVKIVFQDKRIGITKSDLATWDLEDVGWLRHDLCNILSIRNYLTDYVFDVLQDYWKDSRSTME